MKIQIGEYEVYAEGTIVSIPNEPVRFLIEDLTFELRFQDDEDNPEMKIEAKPLDNKKGVTLLFKNFNNNLGTGNLKLLPLGFIGNKNLFFNYRIHALSGVPDKGEAGKTIHYTWLTKEREEAQNG